MGILIGIAAYIIIGVLIYMFLYNCSCSTYVERYKNSTNFLKPSFNDWYNVRTDESLWDLVLASFWILIPIIFIICYPFHRIFKYIRKKNGIIEN